MKGSPADVSALTRAMALHDFIRAEVIKKFLGVPGVKIKDKRGLLVVCFHDRVVIRFKKFRGKSLKTSGNWNQQTAAFETHQLELPETSVQPVTHLVAGYLLDELAAARSRRWLSPVWLMGITTGLPSRSQAWPPDILQRFTPALPEIRPPPSLVCVAPGARRTSKERDMNPRMLTVARDAQGLTQKELGKPAVSLSRTSARLRTGRRN